MYKLGLLSILLLAHLFAVSCSSSDALSTAMNTDHVATVSAGKPVSIYFFERWAGYSHPVNPINALYLEQAIERPTYARAWMTHEGSYDLYVRLEMIENTKTSTDIPAPDGRGGRRFYRVLHAETMSAGSELSLTEWLSAQEYLTSLPSHPGYLTYVRSHVALSFRYIYRDGGVLDRVVIQNLDGETRELDY